MLLHARDFVTQQEAEKKTHQTSMMLENQDLHLLTNTKHKRSSRIFAHSVTACYKALSGTQCGAFSYPHFHFFIRGGKFGFLIGKKNTQALEI
jgi:hypothetical protein